MAGIRAPDDTKHGRIVLQLVGPVARLQFCHDPSGWVIRSRPAGLDVAREVERLRRAANKAGWAVELGYVVEDLRRDTDGSLIANG